ncbi:lysosome-associated membrane glycoprotein 1 [Pleurodeles waltl]|uniref:lysosome-associated membrane glycoprotein 1 n=1 Tax=Pleurodeles waltl TaxID=8319 RepID=UPI0037097370
MALGGSWWRTLLAIVLLGFLQTSSAVLFDVKDGDNKSCIMADLSLNFSVQYKVSDKQRISIFSLPDNAVVHHNSTCGDGSVSSPILAVTFGEQHILSLHFNKTATEYFVVELNIVFNQSDKALFPNATDKEIIEVSSRKTDIVAQINTTYRCVSDDQLNMGNANVTLHNIKIEAYLEKNNFSAEETVCSKDKTPSTTQVPITNSTAKPTVPTPPPAPVVGTYNVSDGNGTCLLISSGLQLNITYQTKNNKTALDVFSLDPSQVTHTGKCTPSPAITLIMKQTVLSLTFVKNSSSNVFYLGSVVVNTSLPDDAQASTFSATNLSTFYLKAGLGHSYMCKAEETLKISNDCSINTVNLQVQAYHIDGGKFGAVEECQLDENSMLVPIIVGAALAGLVLIVLIAYLIGRKRSHAGYQTI